MLLCYSFITKDSKSESHVHLKSELMFLNIMQSIEREGDLYSFQGLNLLILSEKIQKQWCAFVQEMWVVFIKFSFTSEIN